MGGIVLSFLGDSVTRTTIVYEPPHYPAKTLDPSARGSASAHADFSLEEAAITLLNSRGRLLERRGAGTADAVDIGPPEESPVSGSDITINRLVSSKEESILVMAGLAASLGLEGADADVLVRASLLSDLA